MIRQYFPNDATRAGIVRLTEDRLNNTPPDYLNHDKKGNPTTTDAGAYMNNSATFNDLIKTNPGRAANRGMTSFNDLRKNVELATRMAQLTADPTKTGTYRWGGYVPPVPNYPLGVNKPGPWFGPNDAGFDLSRQVY